MGKVTRLASVTKRQAAAVALVLGAEVDACECGIQRILSTHVPAGSAHATAQRIELSQLNATRRDLQRVVAVIELLARRAADTRAERRAKRAEERNIRRQLVLPSVPFHPMHVEVKP